MAVVRAARAAAVERVAERVADAGRGLVDTVAVKAAEDSAQGPADTVAAMA